MRTVTSKGIRSKIPRKKRFDWTHELHVLFVFAVAKLGGTIAATPTAVLKVMNVKVLDLDRIKVGNHLQYFRLRMFKQAAAAFSSAKLDGKEAARRVSEAIRQKKQMTYLQFQDHLINDAQSKYIQNVLCDYLDLEIPLLLERNIRCTDFGIQPPPQQNVFQTEETDDSWE